MSVLAPQNVNNVALEDMLIGKSQAIVGVRRMIGRVAAANASVMITGSSGTGKEVVARAIHSLSPRSNNSYVALNCGAIPAELMESELFGHEKGSFTGANSRRIGRFEEAHNGTLFLDEIGDMRFDMQVKLLRVLEERTVSRIGGTGCLPVDVRIISATHQNIPAAIARNDFREDLFFRLGVVPIYVPDLAERLEDIALLVTHFQKGKARAECASFDASAKIALMQHDWPGNVRELRNFVERADVLFPGEILRDDDVRQLLNFQQTCLAFNQNEGPFASDTEQSAVPPMPETGRTQVAPTSSKVQPVQPGQPINLREIVEQMELEQIRGALQNADGVISEAARLLTLKRTTLIEKMRKYGVPKAA